MIVDLGGAAAQLGLEGGIVGAHRLPVVGELLQPVLAELRIPDRPFEGRKQGVQVRLGGQAGDRRERGVDDISYNFV